MMSNQPKLLTLQLSSEDYNHLATEAQRLNLPLDTFAQRLLKSSLDKTLTQLDSKKAIIALGNLREIARNIPTVDAVEIARKSREDLEQRFIF